MTEKDDVMLDLDINSNAPKSGGFFATDQTPTPTKLYNCEEYGIFEDLKLVNPFDEIFRHAVEQKNEKTQKGTVQQITTQLPIQDEESLHTPQVVFPTDVTLGTTAPTPLRQQSTPLITDLVMTDVETTSNEPMKKYRAIAEKPTESTQQSTQSQLVTVTITDNCNSKSTSGTAIPIQTVKPLILPKVETKLKPNNQTSTSTSTSSLNGICIVTSPSSASLTPTSQLPIKERLKVILNNNSKTQRALACAADVEKTTNNVRRTQDCSTSKYNERCMERRRAAATRYRNKMRNEHKELRKRNSELQLENEKLRARVHELEQQQQQQQQQLAQRSTSLASNAPSNPQIHIPPSSIHLIMNIPKLLVPANGTPLLHNHITYNVSVEKK